MDSAKKLSAELDAIFHPESLALIGLPRGMKMGKLFLTAHRDMGFSGAIYPVHPEASEIDGIKAYPSVSAIPGPIDLAIVLVPHDRVLAVVTECAAKGVKGAILFSAGYGETGTKHGKAMEQELTAVARSSGMRLMGPNCMGVYCPGAGLSFFPGLPREAGHVGFISHSGSLANILAHIAPRIGIRFSKAVSLGNECDLTCADLLTYLGHDSETEVIGAYVEGIKDGPYFLRALRGASLKKPVILWRVGLTPEGSRAAASHTGAIAGSAQVWSAVVRQGGAVPVEGLEALADALMGFSLLPDRLGDRMAILAGPGGLAVAAAEAAGKADLRLAALSDDTRSALSEFIPPTGTSLSNPVDVGLSASLQMEIYLQGARMLAADPGVDAVVAIGTGLSKDSNRLYLEAMIQAQRDYGKPFLIVKIPGFDSAVLESYSQSGIPFFDSVERAMNVYAAVRNSQIRRNAKAQCSSECSQLT
ncbi:MAG: CoA-binding protein [Deltaproteobacteria bacterium]